MNEAKPACWLLAGSASPLPLGKLPCCVFLRVQGPPGADGGVGCKGLMVRRGTLLLYWHPLTRWQRFTQPWCPGIKHEGCYWLTRLQTHLPWFERTVALWLHTTAERQPVVAEKRWGFWLDGWRLQLLVKSESRHPALRRRRKHLHISEITFKAFDDYKRNTAPDWEWRSTYQADCGCFSSVTALW